jgi:hypothetical protein
MRIFLHTILPFLLPTLVFIAWVVLSQRHDHEKSVVERISGGPWLWLLLGGFVLFAGGLAYLSLEGEPPGGSYQAPRYEDGKIVPGKVVR